MPAKSRAQQRFMGMALAAQRGKGHFSKKVHDAAKGMSEKQIRDFAKTKTNKLPEKKAFVEGFVKRASEHGCSYTQALEILKQAEGALQTSIPGETPQNLLGRIRSDKINFPKFLSNAQQHSWNVGVPFGNTGIQSFLKENAGNPNAIKQKINSFSDEQLLKAINKNTEAFKGVQAQPQGLPGQAKVAAEYGFDRDKSLRLLKNAFFGEPAYKKEKI
jgi:hypothetical protein